MRKFKFIFLLVISSIIFLTVLNNVFFISNSKLEFFQKNNSKLNYMHFGKLYSNRECILNLEASLKKDNCLLQQVYIQKDEIVYFSYQYVENNNVHWCIATIKTDGSDFNTLCDEIFNSGNLHEFEINLSESYMKRNGYCYNNKIVLTDFSKLIEYSIDTAEKNVYDYDNYFHPTESFYYDIENDEKIVMIKNDQTHILTIYDLIKKNDIAKLVFEKYNNKTINGTNACDNFFDNVQFINGQVYVIGRVYRWDGSVYALVFEYNFETESVEYCGGHYTNDLIRQFYLLD